MQNRFKERMTMKIGIIIQARTASTRFPRKILQPLPYNSSFTVLDQVIARAKRARKVSEVVIATTTNSSDDEIPLAAKRNGAYAFRGSENDVLARYYYAAKERSLDAIVRLTSDCPCIDWNVIDEMIGEFDAGTYDYLSNTLKRTYPHGLDTEIFSFEALRQAFKEAERPEFREHVTPYLYLMGKFRTGNFEAPVTCYGPNIRITLDTKEDYALICAVYDYLYDRKPNFACDDIVNLFKEKKWLYLINEKTLQKKILGSLEEEVEEAMNLLEMHDLKKAKQFLSQKYYEHST